MFVYCWAIVFHLLFFLFYFQIYFQFYSILVFRIYFSLVMYRGTLSKFYFWSLCMIYMILQIMHNFFMICNTEIFLYCRSHRKIEFWKMLAFVKVLTFFWTYTVLTLKYQFTIFLTLSKIHKFCKILMFILLWFFICLIWWIREKKKWKDFWMGMLILFIWNNLKILQRKRGGWVQLIW